jgi:hypothetical protein
MTRKWMLQPVRRCAAGELSENADVVKWYHAILPRWNSRVRTPSSARSEDTVPLSPPKGHRSGREPPWPLNWRGRTVQHGREIGSVKPPPKGDCGWGRALVV